MDGDTDGVEEGDCIQQTNKIVSAQVVGSALLRGHTRRLAVGSLHGALTTHAPALMKEHVAGFAVMSQLPPTSGALQVAVNASVRPDTAV